TDGDTGGADVLPFPDRRQDTEARLGFSTPPRGDGTEETTVSTGGDPEITGDPPDPPTWRGPDRYGRDIQTGQGTSTTEDGDVVHDTGTFTPCSPEHQIVLDHQQQNTTDTEQD